MSGTDFDTEATALLARIETVLGTIASTEKLVLRIFSTLFVESERTGRRFELEGRLDGILWVRVIIWTTPGIASAGQFNLWTYAFHDGPRLNLDYDRERALASVAHEDTLPGEISKIFQLLRRVDPGKLRQAYFSPPQSVPVGRN